MSTHKRPNNIKNKAKKPNFKAAKASGGRHERFERPAAAGAGDFLFGRHAVMAALQHGRRPLKTLWLAKADKEAEELAAKANVRVEIKDKSAFDNKFTGLTHQGIALQVGALAPVELKSVMNQTRLLMLDQITDPHNLGAILRSSDAFGYAAVLVPSHNTAPITDVVAKTACGALETVPVIEVGNLNQTLKKLQDDGFWCVGLAGEATKTLPELSAELAAGKLPKKLCVVMGSEGDGLRRMVAENCDELIKIPMVGSVESLNVSVATGVTLAALMKT